MRLRNPEVNRVADEGLLLVIERHRGPESMRSLKMLTDRERDERKIAAFFNALAAQCASNDSEIRRFSDDRYERAIHGGIFS